MGRTKTVNDNRLQRTSAIDADIGFRTETTLVSTTNGISRTFVVDRTVDHFDALGERIGIRYGTTGTNATERSRRVHAQRVLSASVEVGAFVNVCKKKKKNRKKTY